MKSDKNIFAHVISTVFLLLVTIVFAFPFYWVVTGSFKIQKLAVLSTPQWIPIPGTLANWTKLLNANTFQWFFNSVFISTLTMFLVCLTAALAGYALAKKKFIGQTIIFTMLIAAMSLPKQVILVPLVQLVSRWGFHDTPFAVILPLVGFPFGVFLMKQFSETLPDELLESAKIDGCGEIKTFTSIVFPMIKPGIGALAIFTFISSWNDYFLQLIMLNSNARYTLPLGVALMQQEFSINYGLLMAGATFAAMPIVIVFISFQKYFTQGITMGAVKG